MAKKICFVSLNSKILFEKEQKFSGGAEIQQFYLAKFFREHGWDISFVTGKIYDRVESDFRIFETIEIENFRRRGRLFRISRMSFLFFSLFWSILRSRADIVYLRGFTPVSALSYYYSRLLRKKVVFVAANDKDLLPEKHGKFMRWAMRMHRGVNRVIMINKGQKHLTDILGVKNPIFIPNFIQPDHRVESMKITGDIILWIAGFRPIKRAHLFLELARSFPDREFVMIGPDDLNDIEYSQSIRKHAMEIPNLEVYGYTPSQELDKYYRRALCFVSTSENEGFGNVILQSWLHGIPVVSYAYNIYNNLVKEVDNREVFGIVTPDHEEIDQYLKRLELMSKDKRRENRHYLNSYVKENYTLETIGSKYLDVLESLP